jgi:hypothetical protein
VRVQAGVHAGGLRDRHSDVHHCASAGWVGVHRDVPSGVRRAGGGECYLRPWNLHRQLHRVQAGVMRDSVHASELQRVQLRREHAARAGVHGEVFAERWEGAGVVRNTERAGRLRLWELDWRRVQRVRAVRLRCGVQSGSRLCDQRVPGEQHARHWALRCVVRAAHRAVWAVGVLSVPSGCGCDPMLVRVVGGDAVRGLR